MRSVYRAPVRRSKVAVGGWEGQARNQSARSRKATMNSNAPNEIIGLRGAFSQYAIGIWSQKSYVQYIADDISIQT